MLAAKKNAKKIHLCARTHIVNATINNAMQKKL
jgi:hypothetical protein